MSCLVISVCYPRNVHVVKTVTDWCAVVSLLDSIRTIPIVSNDAFITPMNVRISLSVSQSSLVADRVGKFVSRLLTRIDEKGRDLRYVKRRTRVVQYLGRL